VIVQGAVADRQNRFDQRVGLLPEDIQDLGVHDQYSQ